MGEGGGGLSAHMVIRLSPGSQVTNCPSFPSLMGLGDNSAL